jgi:hypothetical protein
VGGWAADWYGLNRGAARVNLCGWAIRQVDD